MGELAQTITASAFALIALAVASAIAGAVLSRRRMRARMPTRAAVAGSALDVAAVAGVLAVLVITFAPTGQYEARAVHLLPFSDFASMASSDGVLSAIAQALANIALFVPLGLVVPARWPPLDAWARVLGASAAFSASIEVVQFAVGSGHTSSTDDVLWNTLGGLLGYALLRGARRIRRRAPSGRPGPSLSRASP